MLSLIQKDNARSFIVIIGDVAYKQSNAYKNLKKFEKMRTLLFFMSYSKNIL